MGRIRTTTSSRDEAAARSAILRVESYEVSLDLRGAEDQNEPGFISKTVITFSCTEPGATVFADFIHGGVHSVQLNGRPLDPADVVDGSRIRLRGLQPENQVTITGTALYSTLRRRHAPLRRSRRRPVLPLHPV